MINFIVNFKAKFSKIIRNEYLVILFSLFIFLYAPISWKTKLEDLLGKKISLDSYMLALNIFVNFIMALFISFLSIMTKNLKTLIVSKGKNRQIKLINTKPTVVYLDIFFKKTPWFSNFIFQNTYLKLEAPLWVELTMNEAIQFNKNELLIPLNEYLNEEIRLSLNLIKSGNFNNINRNKSLTSKIIFKEKSSINIIRSLLLILTFQYESLDESIEEIVGE